ncbi:hypothetical protein QFW77_09805 [Luteimonas sp. RD2P54]|uniref:Uncharacterized protein n=1 Tax=Luteimonas endophytica TaxID=3042023 RepID=A0ABT6J8Y4_9GAMM|nr:hypothetical protein [Luteimonas endophytica]MDH5823277.1 hypothetical protein [Luteimonas endophytica]
MNAQPQPSDSTLVPQRSRTPAPQPAGARRDHRPRDFGVGYGSSSGYARDRHYLDRSPAPRFRCA